MSTPTLSDVSKKMIDLMCISPAAVTLQCDREYRFSRGKELCVRNLSNLAPKQLDSLPTNNLVTERDLRLDLKRGKSSKEPKHKNLKQRTSETIWFFTKTTKKLKSPKCHVKYYYYYLTVGNQSGGKIAATVTWKTYYAKAKKLLGNCEIWAGTYTSVDEIHEILKAKPNEQKCRYNVRT